MQTTIQTRLTLAFFALAIGPLLVVGVLLSWQSFASQKEQALELQRELAQRAASEVAAFISEAEVRLDTVVRDFRSQEQNDERHIHTNLSRLLSSADVFEELTLMDSRGQELDRVSRRVPVSPAELGDRSGADEFLLPIASGDVYYSPVRFDQMSGEPLMTLAVPLIDARSAQVTRVLAAEIRLKKVWDLVAGIRVGDSGSAYIVNPMGEVVAHRNPSVVLSGTSFALPDRDGIHHGLAGGMVVLASEPIRLGSQTLHVVVERPLSEALAPTIRSVLTIAGLLVIALAAAAALAFMAVRRIVRPIQALAATAKTINAGDLSPPIEVHGKDEVGQLADSLRLMVDRLKSAFSALREKVRELETEVAERKRAEKTVKHLAHHDDLTDLPNRTLLKDRLTMALAQARRNKQMLAVMFLDLDRFKVVNDTAGHTEGDELLKIVSGQLKQLVREGDTVARVGGDEFVLLLPTIARVGDVTEVAKRIIDSFRRPSVLAGHEFHITSSIGITIFPTDGDDADTLLTNADMAMYHAKGQGRDNYQFYTPALNTSILERLALENDLRHGLEREEFVVYYQPQVNISTGQIVGVEALLRWQHPDRGLVMPMEFIPVAEETGLIVPLGEWVLRTACAQAKAWQDAGLSPLRMAVNLSARQFQQRDLAEKVRQILQETGLDPHCLQLEITEGVAIQDVDFAIMMLRHLKEMGVQIAIDDFGTGYSSLSYLRRLPIDVVKIDQSFVRDLTTNPKDAEIAATVISMAHNLDLGVVAEGVETEEQLAFLKQRDCDEMQGYLFSRPVSAEALQEILVQDDRSQVA